MFDGMLGNLQAVGIVLCVIFIAWAWFELMRFGGPHPGNYAVGRGDDVDGDALTESGIVPEPEAPPAQAHAHAEYIKQEAYHPMQAPMMGKASVQAPMGDPSTPWPFSRHGGDPYDVSGDYQALMDRAAQEIRDARNEQTWKE